MNNAYIFFGLLVFLIVLVLFVFIKRDNYIVDTITLSNNSNQYLSFANNSISLSNTPSNMVFINPDFPVSFDYHTKIGDNRFISVNGNLLEPTENADYSWSVVPQSLSPEDYQNYLHSGITPLMIDGRNRISFGMFDPSYGWRYLYLVSSSLNFSTDVNSATIWNIN